MPKKKMEKLQMEFSQYPKNKKRRKGSQNKLKINNNNALGLPISKVAKLSSRRFTKQIKPPEISFVHNWDDEIEDLHKDDQKSVSSSCSNLSGTELK